MQKGGKNGRHTRNRENRGQKERKKGIKVETEMEGGERGKKEEGVRDNKKRKQGEHQKVSRYYQTILEVLQMGKKLNQ